MECFVFITFWSPNRSDVVKVPRTDSDSEPWSRHRPGGQKNIKKTIFLLELFSMSLLFCIPSTLKERGGTSQWDGS